MVVPPSSSALDCGGKRLDLSCPRLMGILNVTPDSFSDGGRYSTVSAAVAHGIHMVESGADLIDVGGESTRPGADQLDVPSEIGRIVRVIEILSREVSVPISIDTRKPKVMRAAVDAGAGMINDVEALQAPGALSTAVDLGVPVCLMHMKGVPQNMQTAPRYVDVVDEVEIFLRSRAKACIAAGIKSNQILLDPGIGFGKNVQHNIALLGSIPRLARLGFPILIGASRKTMIGTLLGNRPVEDRVAGSLGAAITAALSGARVLRVHDVKQTADALRVAWAITQSEV